MTKHLLSGNVSRQPLSRSGIQLGGRTAAPFPPASLSGEGLEGGVVAVASVEA